MAEDTTETARTEDQLQASARLFLTEVDRLGEIEREKEALPPGHEDRLALARQVEDVVVELVSMSRYQTRLVELQAQSLDGHDGPVRAMPKILEEWREAERRLHDARTAMERAADQTNRLREEHRQAALRDGS